MRPKTEYKQESQNAEIKIDITIKKKSICLLPSMQGGNINVDAHSKQLPHPYPSRILKKYFHKNSF